MGRVAPIEGIETAYCYLPTLPTILPQVLHLDIVPIKVLRGLKCVSENRGQNRNRDPTPKLYTRIDGIETRKLRPARQSHPCPRFYTPIEGIETSWEAPFESF